MNRLPRYSLLSVLGIVIISLLLSGIVSNVSASSGLGVTVSIAKNPISRGSVESVAVKVTNNGKAATNAIVSVIVVYESGFTKSFSGKTDAKGLRMFSWQIGGNSNPGTFDVYVKASKSGFESGSTRTSFTVTTANGKLMKHY